MARTQKKERMTRYECARILGIRASQIGMSAPVLIDMTLIPTAKQGNLLYVAAMELKAGVLDVVVRRPLPMDRYVEVNIRDMDLPDDLDALIAMYSDM